MDPDDILGYIVVTVLVIVPALTFTARFGLLPLLDALRRKQAPSGLDERLAALEGAVHELRDENAGLREDVQALQSAESFYRELARPAQPGAALAAGGVDDRG
jgi:hypothetical protein